MHNINRVGRKVSKELKLDILNRYNRHQKVLVLRWKRRFYVQAKGQAKLTVYLSVTKCRRPFGRERKKVDDKIIHT